MKGCSGKKASYQQEIALAGSHEIVVGPLDDLSAGCLLRALHLLQPLAACQDLHLLILEDQASMARQKRLSC